MPLSLRFAASTPVWLEFPGPSVLMDIDGNGRPELIAARFSLPGGELLPIYALEFGPNETLIDRSDDLFRGAAPMVDFGRGVLARDVNGDGFDDLMIADHGLDVHPFPGARNLIMLSDGRGHLVNVSHRLGAETDFTHSLAAGDVDGDGRAEVFWNNLGVDPARLTTINRDGSVTDFAGGLPRLEDFTTVSMANLDGRRGDEIVLGVDQNIAPNGANRLLSYRDGRWSSTDLPTIDRPEGAIMLASRIVDIDGDGDRDILFIYTSASPFYQGWGLQVLTQGARGAFTDRTADFLPLSRQTDRRGEWASDLFLEDLNGDGREDLVISRNFPGDHLLFFQNARGRFVAQDVQFGTQDSVAIGDVTGDRRPDIVVTSGLTVRVYEVDQETRLNESITGRLSGDRLYGGHGQDSIAGRAGADLILGGSGADRINGGTGRDRLFGEGGNDRISGQRGNDRIDGGTGHDRLAGAAGHDLLLGRGGRDVLDGGTGNDRMTGGRGADDFIFRAGHDRITDFRPGQGDELHLSRAALDLGGRNARAVLRDFAEVRDGRVVLEFNDHDSVTLMNVGSLRGLADDIVLF